MKTSNQRSYSEWKDAETEAIGWVVINSLRGGAAGGGTRMRPGLDKREVESLAKTMEVKFTVAELLRLVEQNQESTFDPKTLVKKVFYKDGTQPLLHY